MLPEVAAARDVPELEVLVVPALLAAAALPVDDEVVPEVAPTPLDPVVPNEPELDIELPDPEALLEAPEELPVAVGSNK